MIRLIINNYICISIEPTFNNLLTMNHAENYHKHFPKKWLCHRTFSKKTVQSISKLVKIQELSFFNCSFSSSPSFTLILSCLTSFNISFVIFASHETLLLLIATILGLIAPAKRVKECFNGNFFLACAQVILRKFCVHDPTIILKCFLWIWVIFCK